MKRIMSLCAAALVCAAAFAAATDDDGVTMKNGVAVPDRPILLNGGPGIVISGSQTLENMPSKAWNFLKDNYKDTPVEKCTENFVKQTYHVILSDGTNLTFAKDGSVRDLYQANNASIPEKALEAILPAKAVKHLREAGVLDEVSAVRNAGPKGFGVILLNNIPPQMIFDVDGMFILVAG